jgi:hypothetical protein
MSKITIELTERAAKLLLSELGNLKDTRLRNQLHQAIIGAYEKKQKRTEESLRLTVMRRRSVVESLKRVL